MKTKIFTLIELLIVIAIIAILAAMLLPALNKARQTARAYHFVGKVRQILIATQAYLGDSNGVYYSVYLGPYFRKFH
ncbi:MAG: prepilin-type N-terminal cleavage/methylation domain-containing protein [Victivallales bacterium]